MPQIDDRPITVGPKFEIETDIPKAELAERLKAMEPWRIGVSFSNGLNTADFETMQPFSDIPLNKLRMILEHCGQDWVKGKRALDVGSNIGYNSIALADLFGCQVTGLDFNGSNVEKARILAEISGATAEFLQGDAGTYRDEAGFDLILHLGTLYHLPDPIQALKCSAQNLRSGGRLYIETAVYNGEDVFACRYIHGLGGDYTNYWALSPTVVSEILEHHGLSKVEMIKNINIKLYEGTGMSRALFCAEKA